MAGGEGEDVYCTLVMSDNYLPGAAVLAHSLRDSGTTRKLACMITQESLQGSTITELQSLYNYVIPVERLGNPIPANLYLMNRPDLLYAFTKINLWRLTQFRKIVYVDADVVALRAPDELFNLPDNFAAAPDVGWPDAFNTGVMVVTPQMGEYSALKTLASAGNSFDGADQGLLNQYYEHRPWKRLSFTYNCTPSANYQYEPAYRYYKRDICMVHFIGSNKPWQQGRAGNGAPIAYQELLSRWWAVYDAHFTVSTNEYISTGRGEPSSHAVQREAKGKAKSADPGFYATGYPLESTTPAPPPAITMTEAPLTTARELEVQPTQKPPFSAPHMQWDASHAEPPSNSAPEAANFPVQTYEFSTSNEQFIPPVSYPRPPKDMWYNVPEEKAKPPAKLTPIFPWEEREVSKPTRRFAEDEQQAIPPEPDLQGEVLGGTDELEVTVDDKKSEPTAPAAKTESSWQTFGSTNKNAWDEVGGIGEYVRALSASQKRRGKSQGSQFPGVPRSPSSSAAAAAAQAGPDTHILSPTNEMQADELIENARERRESLILTDFPSAVERPSLPVTPAPRRRPTFWGLGSDESGELPPAEGVPDQADWNADDRLEQLRRNSLIGPGDLKLLPQKTLPSRKMPSSSVPIPEEAPGPSHAPPVLPPAAERYAGAPAAASFIEPTYDVAAGSTSATAVQQPAPTQV